MIAVMIAVIAVTVVVTIPLLAPLMLGPEAQQKQGWALLSFITLFAVGIYLWRGSPDIPSQPAMFEKSGPNFEKRAAVKKEIELTHALTAAPNDANLMLELGTVRLQNGQLDRAIAILSTAYAKDPTSPPLRLKLGAAHYAAALSALLLDDSKPRALAHFEKALEIAPKDAPYREKLLQDLKNAQDET